MFLFGHHFHFSNFVFSAGAYSIPCNGDDKFQECFDMLQNLCPIPFELKTLVGARSKKGTRETRKCIWIAGYVKQGNVSIQENLAISAAQDISETSPIGGHAILIGRAWFDNRVGVIVKWRCSRCKCAPFFDGTTPSISPNIGRYPQYKTLWINTIIHEQLVYICLNFSLAVN